MTMIYHTDRCHQLIAAARAAEKRDLRLSDAVRSSIFLLHNEAAEELPLKSKSRVELREVRSYDCFDQMLTFPCQALKSIFHHKFDPAIDEIAALQHCSLENMDMVSSVGERLSNKIMATYLRDHGVAAVDIPTDGLLITTKEHGGALPLLPETRQRVHPRVQSELAKLHVPCFTGFIGTTLEGKTTTLGRGGSAHLVLSHQNISFHDDSSDLTAAVLANVLDAEEVILSKVSTSLMYVS